MTTLENDHLRVSIRPKGAELTSIFHKPSGIEHLWQADAMVWGWHAPNLFPVVGGCLNNQLLIDGKTYPIERHGFTRQSLFETTESTLTHAVFSLWSSDATRIHFPYEFEFQIIYELDGPRLTITYRVVNEDEKPIFFSVGAHPAFAVPFTTGEAYEDYFIEFEQPESLETHMLSAAGYFTGETKPVPTDGRRLLLTKHLFDEDALVFKNLVSRRVVLRSDKHDHSIAVGFPEFPYLGLWAKPGASFVCIEPWLGCADSEGQPKPIEQKEAIQQVAEGKVFEAAFTIEVR
ncbi:aldose 1-epimerase family protein [Spirosoma sp. KCTC 42546]|uniref:aldose 1-epimerase family protein n=1 Tax=Spirosoma sp. KCTC 42546 TaxID=2520506 RepID=UPI00115A470F|nr:aldose 1-epimerase family protein [Spirosoma sp. KCTC 42546]QDK78044.1 aldose 1-epimerase family protein [Spirosoma sp. KCTC 42546]